MHGNDTKRSKVIHKQFSSECESKRASNEQSRCFGLWLQSAAVRNKCSILTVSRGRKREDAQAYKLMDRLEAIDVVPEERCLLPPFPAVGGQRCNSTARLIRNRQKHALLMTRFRLQPRERTEKCDALVIGSLHRCTMNSKERRPESEYSNFRNKDLAFQLRCVCCV